MLPDLERKLLRILYNFSAGRGRMPALNELEIKTGRRQADIIKALDYLACNEYILWPHRPYTQTIQIIEGWDRDFKEAPRTSSKGTPHWEY